MDDSSSGGSSNGRAFIIPAVQMTRLVYSNEMLIGSNSLASVLIADPTALGLWLPLDLQLQNILHCM